MRSVTFIFTLFILLLSILLFPTAIKANGITPINPVHPIRPITPLYADTSFFTECPNPGGTQVASYADGWHWIVGEADLKWGSDSVYGIGNGNYVQCYCDTAPRSTQGIQTNWLKVGNIKQEQIDFLTPRGWIWVQNGADFGLSPEPYLAKNSRFMCNKCN